MVSISSTAAILAQERRAKMGPIAHVGKPDYVAPSCSSPRGPDAGDPAYEDRDLEAVSEILDQPRCRDGLGRDPFAESAEVKAWFDVLPPRTAKLVAVSGDVPVGIGILAPDGGSRAHTGSSFLAVHDRFHRRGIGGALLRTLIASAERFYRLERLGLVVVCKNDVAIKMYQKYGFQIEGRQVGALHYGGRFHDTYGMALAATGSALAAS